MRPGRPFVLILLALVAALAAGPALAQDRIDGREACENANGTLSPAQAVSACTAYIAQPRVARDDLVSAYISRGLAHDTAGETELAVRDFSKALELQPADLFALENRARAHRAAGRPEQALADFDAIARLTPQDPAALYNRGNAYAQIKQYDKAIADYTAAIAIDGEYAQAFNNRGSARHMLGQYALALPDFDRAIALNDEYPAALANRCRARAVLGEGLEQAEADCSAALALRPEDSLTLDTRGLVRLRKGDFQSAFRDYDQAYRLNDRQHGSLFGRGVAQLRLGRREAGQADIALATERDPTAPAMYERSGIKP